MFNNTYVQVVKGHKTNHKLLVILHPYRNRSWRNSQHVYFLYSGPLLSWPSTTTTTLLQWHLYSIRPKHTMYCLPSGLRMPRSRCSTTVVLCWEFFTIRERGVSALSSWCCMFQRRSPNALCVRTVQLARRYMYRIYHLYHLYHVTAAL